MRLYLALVWGETRMFRLREGGDHELHRCSRIGYCIVWMRICTNMFVRWVMQREIVSRAWLGGARMSRLREERLFYGLESGYKDRIGITLFISKSLETLGSA